MYLFNSVPSLEIFYFVAYYSLLMSLKRLCGILIVIIIMKPVKKN